MSNIISSSKKCIESNECIECIDAIVEPDVDIKENISWINKTNSNGDTNLKSLVIASVNIYNFGSLMSKLKRLSKQ